MFVGLLAGLVNESNHTKFLLLSNLKCMIQPTIINIIIEPNIIYILMNTVKNYITIHLQLN